MKKLFLLSLILITLFCLTGCGKKTNETLINSNSDSTPSISSPSPEPTKNYLTQYQIPILMYHYIRDFNDPNDQTGTNLSVSPKRFDEQLIWLEQNNYQTVSMDYIEKPYELSDGKKPIVITFDDGYRDAYTDAYPILKKHNMTGTFYLIYNFSQKNDANYLTWDMAKNMAENNMQLGSHTLSHPNLIQVSTTNLKKEIEESKQKIQEQTGVNINHFCYPSGKYNNDVITTLKSADYKTAVTTKSGITNQDSALFELPRIRMTNSTNLEITLEK